jgi:membrane associated rhomboid family serine protease
MFLFPYNTDAPIYHFPLITISMIVINVVAFVLTVLNPDSAVQFCLDHGNGLHPLQWITSSFMHAGLMHLIGNMVALWTFGLIVEGKIGSWRMLVLYMGIGIVQNVIEQTFMLWATPNVSLGASAIIYGLMAISLLWAPQNSLDCVFVLIICFYPIVRFFEVSVSILAGAFISLAVVGSLLTGLEMSSMLLHSMGAVIGGAVGLWMLKSDRVDCENWDLFSVWAGKHQMTDDELQALAEKDPAYQEEKRQREFESRRGALNKIRGLVKNGNPQEAFEFYRRKAVLLDHWRLPEADLRNVITAFHKLGQWGASIPAMVELLQSSPENSAVVRLKLAQILVQKERRPAQAWNVLSKVDPGSLDAKQRTYYDSLKQMVFKAKAEDPYDSVDADW